MKKLTILFTVFILAFANLAFAGNIPDTGQTKCYDNYDEIPCPKPGESFYGQDANYSINPPSYTVLGGGTMVQDNVTGLIWESKQASDGNPDFSNIHDANNTYTWQDAQDIFIKKLNDEKFGGYSDWRLPTREELRSIVNYGKYKPAIDETYFPNTVLSSLSSNAHFWSADTIAWDADSAWGVNFTYGYVNAYFSKSRSWYMRAVRGGRYGSFDNLIINNDSTVTDTMTGLVWQQGEAGQMTWEKALEYCENLTLAGKNDWRLPTVRELASITKSDTYNPAADTLYFPDIKSDFYWSSTTVDWSTRGPWASISATAAGTTTNISGCRIVYVRCVADSLGHLIIW